MLLQTGDEGEMDSGGYIKITGRIKDLIIKGGENIHPLEVENCLFSHPAVKEVSVVGLPNERYGEVVTAFVIPVTGMSITEEEVRTWVREKLSHHLGKLYGLYLAFYLSLRWRLTSPVTVPKYVFWVDNYPKTASGKIQKFKLKEEGLLLVRDGKGLR